MDSRSEGVDSHYLELLKEGHKAPHLLQNSHGIPLVSSLHLSSTTAQHPHQYHKRSAVIINNNHDNELAYAGQNEKFYTAKSPKWFSLTAAYIRKTVSTSYIA